MNAPESKPRTNPDLTKRKQQSHSHKNSRTKSIDSDLIEHFQNDTHHIKKKVYGASLTSIASNNLLFSFFHLYAVDLGSTPFTQSIITSQNQLGNTILQPYFGSKSDEKGRRPYLMLGWGALALTNFLILLMQLLGKMTIPFLLLILLFQTILGSAWIPAWTAYMGDITTKKKRGSVIGTITAAGTIFSIVIIIIAGNVMERLGGSQLDQYIIPFGIATLLLVFSCIFAWRLPETLRKRGNHRARQSMIHILKKNPIFRKFTMINAFAMFAMAMTWPLYSFIYRDVVNITPSQLVLVSSAFSLTTAFSQRWGGKIADIIGRKPGLILGRLILTIYPLMIALSKSWTMILVAELLSGVGSGLVITLASVAILDLTKGEEERGQFTATSNFIVGVMTFIGAFFSGAIAQLLAGSMGQLSAVLFMLYVAATLRFVTALLFLKIPETLNIEHNQ